MAVASIIGGTLLVLQAGKLVSDIIQGESARGESERLQRARRLQLARQEQEEKELIKERANVRRGQLQERLGLSAVAFGAGNIAGGATSRNIKTALAAQASRDQSLDDIATQRRLGIISLRSEGVKAAGEAERLNISLSEFGSVLSTGVGAAGTVRTTRAAGGFGG